MIHLEEKVMKWDVIALVVVHVITRPVCALVLLVTTVQCAKRKRYWDKRQISLQQCSASSKNMVKLRYLPYRMFLHFMESSINISLDFNQIIVSFVSP